jgi:hypothetical protein
MDELIEVARNKGYETDWMSKSKANFKAAHNALTKEMADRRF